MEYPRSTIIMAIIMLIILRCRHCERVPLKCFCCSCCGWRRCWCCCCWCCCWIVADDNIFGTQFNVIMDAITEGSFPLPPIPLSLSLLLALALSLYHFYLLNSKHTNMDTVMLYSFSILCYGRYNIYGVELIFIYILLFHEYDFVLWFAIAHTCNS